MVAPKCEKALIDSTTNKVIFVVFLFFFGKTVGVEDLRKGISLVFEPELFSPLDVLSWSCIGIGF